MKLKLGNEILDIHPVKFMQLHEPLFLAGVNLGLKLYPKSVKGEMGLYFNVKYNIGVVIYKGELSLVPNAANSTMIKYELLDADDNEYSIKERCDTVEKLRPSPSSGTTQVKLDQLNRAHAYVAGGANPLTAQVSEPNKQVQGKKLRPAKYQGGDETQGE